MDRQIYRDIEVYIGIHLYTYMYNLSLVITIVMIPGDFLKKNYLFYLFIFGFIGLRCSARAFSSCGKPGLLFIAVRRLLIAGACLVAEHGL